MGARQGDLSEELESHLRIAIAERVARGEDPARARAAALRELGNIPLIEDVTRERWGGMWLENLLQDLRYAVRQLRRAPAFTATALFTLAFGIGANLGVFQLLYAVILAELPIPHPEEVVRIHAARSPFDQSWTISYPAYQRLRAATPDVPLMATAYAEAATFAVSGRAPVKAASTLVSDNYFSGLGVAPAAGRLFVAADERLGQGEWPVVLRYDFARNTFGSAEQAVGQHVLVNGRGICGGRGGAAQVSRRYYRAMLRTCGFRWHCKAQAHWPCRGIRWGRAMMCRSTSPGITSRPYSGCF